MKNIIFDLGAVMFNWNPKAIAKNFTDDEDLQERIQSQLYHHQDWIDFDNAILTESDATKRASERLGISLLESERLFVQTKESLTLITKTFDLLKDVKDKKLNAYCLSNISPELFQYVAERNDLFELFDGIVTSGQENTGKPGKRIFDILIERFNISTEDSLFIDDSLANTKMADSLGITTVTFKGTNDCYKKIYNYI